MLVLFLYGMVRLELLPSRFLDVIDVLVRRQEVIWMYLLVSFGAVI